MWQSTEEKVAAMKGARKNAEADSPRIKSCDTKLKEKIECISECIYKCDYSLNL